jgi:hypothetical protein
MLYSEAKDFGSPTYWEICPATHLLGDRLSHPPIGRLTKSLVLTIASKTRSIVNLHFKEKS